MLIPSEPLMTVIKRKRASNSSRDKEDLVALSKMFLIEESPGYEGPFEDYRWEQIRLGAKETTPEQRIRLLEEALQLVWSLGIDVNEEKRRLLGKNEDGW